MLENLRVLVADDEPDSIFLLTCILEIAGAEVESAVSIRAALEKLQTSLPDVVISDCNFLDGNGTSLASYIRTLDAAQGRHTPIIAVTGDSERYSGDQYHPELISAGFSWVLVKPVDVDELISVIAHLTQRSDHL